MEGLSGKRVCWLTFATAYMLPSGLHEIDAVA